jgi:hypothetical protein
LSVQHPMPSPCLPKYHSPCAQVKPNNDGDTKNVKERALWNR